MVGDLHVHSHTTSGVYHVAEMLARAKERGLSHIALTDLNTMEAVAEAVKVGARIGLTVLPGVEVTARHAETGREVHILGLDLRLPARATEAICRRLSEASKPAPTAGAQAQGHPPGARPSATLPPAAEVIAAIRSDGGRAVLAHPGPSGAFDLVDDLVGAGLEGIELYHPAHGPEDHERVCAASRRHNLILTGGSDSGDEPGGMHRIGDIRAPYGALRRVVEHRARVVGWAESLVREAGAMARRAVLSEIETELKRGNISDIVTRHDRAIERFLTDAIRARFPEHGFVTEEHDHPDVEPGTPFWIIDPIDGTTNFVSSHSYFGVSLAHYNGDRPLFGIVYDVMADELYLGIHGEGAWVNGRPLHATQKETRDAVVELSLSCAAKLEDRYGADTRAMVKETRAQRAYGSASIGICRIAAGSLDMYISCSLSFWDYAAAVIVLAESGGQSAVELEDARRSTPAGHESGSGAAATALFADAPPGALQDGRHLFLAASGTALLEEVAGKLFTGARKPLFGLLPGIVEA